uniref:hypothetical protein n=1 Tax=Yersinia enterocolitica TaxID=630 RepID=UPI002110F45C
SWSVHFIIPGADALLFYPSSPCKLESERFVILKPIRRISLLINCVILAKVIGVTARQQGSKAASPGELTKVSDPGE